MTYIAEQYKFKRTSLSDAVSEGGFRENFVSNLGEEAENHIEGTEEGSLVDVVSQLAGVAHEDDVDPMDPVVILRLDGIESRIWNCLPIQFGGKVYSKSWPSGHKSPEPGGNW